jgi:hypothetical protein
MSSRSAYEQVHDGEWWLFRDGRSNRRCKIACCDCGLVHAFKIRIRQGRIEMQVNRLPQETGGRRAAMKAERKETARAPR